MATHSSIIAWKIPWTEEPGELQFMGSQRISCDLVTKPPPPGKHYKAKETLMYRTVLWTLWEREWVGRFGRMTLKHV